MSVPNILEILPVGKVTLHQESLHQESSSERIPVLSSLPEFKLYTQANGVPVAGNTYVFFPIVPDGNLTYYFYIKTNVDVL